MNIPLVDLHAQYVPLKDEIFGGMEKVFESMHLFLGENVQALEKEFAGFCGVQFGLGVSDGTSALQIILRALGIGPGDEVITVSHTFIATAEAIILAGATPVFVDVVGDTCLMDVSKVEAKITPRTKAILPVHLYGQTVDMDPLMELAARHGLRVIEDACQAHGAIYKGRRAGSLGDAAGFSFYYSKNLGALGEGGFISTNDSEIYRKARMIRDHGSDRRYYHDMIGFNARLDEIQAVVLRAKFPHLNEYNELRRRNAKKYNELLTNLPVVTPTECPENQHIYHMYVIQAPKRDELQVWLKERGIGTGIHYPVPIHLQKSMNNLAYKPGDFPVTEKIVERILSLPMYPEMTEDAVDYVANAVREFYA
ncbi:MAG: DegT/DnrJ/EryC1/StrS family aminotransferase [Anaerolineaceae bacterium]|nr:DegT/DnrJ/EryC1/StrS family aminotransferase [Anaerolineaceae bacterium]